MPIIWKDVSGWEGLYKISNNGDVYSVRSKREIKQFPNSKGYLRVFLAKNNKTFCEFVHKIALEAFVGPRNGRQCNHLDGGKTNNKISNLEWVSARSNINHKFRNRKMPSGVRKDKNRYRAVIIVNKKPIHLGSFGTKEEASRAYMDFLKKMKLEEKYAR